VQPPATRVRSLHAIPCSTSPTLTAPAFTSPVAFTHNLTHNLRKGWSLRSAGGGRSAAGGIVACGVPREGLGIVCIPSFWVN